MKNKILTIVLIGGLVLTSVGWINSYDNEKFLIETVSKQKVDVDKKSTKIANLEIVIVTKDKKLEADVLVIEKLNDQIQTKDELLKEKDSSIAKIKLDNAKLKRDLKVIELKKVEKSKQTVVSRGEKARATLSVIATAYTPYCKGCTGTSFTGIDVRKLPSNAVIAVDPRVIPLHSKVKVTLQNGESFHAIAGDIGGAIKGNKIDILKATYGEAKSFGRQTVTVTILE